MKVIPSGAALGAEIGGLDPSGPNPYGAPFLPDLPELNVI